MLTNKLLYKNLEIVFTVKEIEMKFGFPLFTKDKNTVYLGNNKKLIISDIWSFWDYVIKKHNKNCDFLSALLEQSKHFYLTAESSPVKSKPLLYYYSFLNLSKIIVAIENGYDSTKTYMHGVSENHNGKFTQSTIRIKQRHQNNSINVAIELAEILDVNIPTTPVTLNVKELLCHCVGVHRAYSEIYKKKEVFFRIYNEKLYKNGREMIFRAQVQCERSNLNELRSRGYVINEVDGDFIYEHTITTNANNKVRADYFRMSQEIREQGLWYFIGNNGYTLYLSNDATYRFSPEVIIYDVMFYLGSITRYHPYMFDKIFSDNEQWLMSEFLTTQPKQYLYLATSKLLGQHVMKAYTSF